MQDQVHLSLRLEQVQVLSLLGSKVTVAKCARFPRDKDTDSSFKFNKFEWRHMGVELDRGGREGVSRER